MEKLLDGRVGYKAVEDGMYLYMMGKHYDAHIFYSVL